MSLSTLNLSFCPGAPSLGIQSILGSSPQLVHLEVDHLYVQDIRNGRPWVCSRLEILAVKLDLRRIETDGPSTAVGQDEKATEKTFVQDQRLVFERLSGLTSLKALTLPRTSRLDHDDRVTDGGLEFRLGFGLDFLATLTRLTSLDIGGSFTGLEMEDVEWMLKT